MSNTTPWGMLQSSSQIATGIRWVTTLGGHGWIGKQQTKHPEQWSNHSRFLFRKRVGQGSKQQDGLGPAG